MTWVRSMLGAGLVTLEMLLALTYGAGAQRAPA